jgi:RNA recognition motif-containing protein
MNTKLYFDNLPSAVTEAELKDLFSASGNVVNVHIAMERAGFVTMITPEAARTAIESLNGKILTSGSLSLSEAPPNNELVSSTNGRTLPLRTASRLY